MQVRWGFGLNIDNFLYQWITISCGYNLPPLNFDIIEKNTMGTHWTLKLNNYHISSLTYSSIGFLASMFGWIFLWLLSYVWCLILFFWMVLCFDIMISFNMLLMVIAWLCLMNNDDGLSWDGFTILTHIAWMMDLDVGFTLFSPRGKKHILFLCL